MIVSAQHDYGLVQVMGTKQFLQWGCSYLEEESYRNIKTPSRIAETATTSFASPT
jgi:hypothetical protein